MLFIGLFCLMILDYLLTKLGIHLGIITEMNPLVNWLIELPLWAGLTIKIIISTGLLYVIYIAKVMHKNIYKFALIVLYLAHIFVMGMHLNWIING